MLVGWDNLLENKLGNAIGLYAAGRVKTDH